MTNTTDTLFRWPQRIRFAHCDPAGIVFFPQYLVMLNTAVEDLVNQGLGIEYHEMIAKRRVGMPTVSLSCEFAAISYHGDEVVFEIQVERLGAKSVTFGVQCKCGTELRASFKQVIVFTSLETHRSIEIPADFRAGLQHYLKPAA